MRGAKGTKSAKITLSKPNRVSIDPLRSREARSEQAPINESYRASTTFSDLSAQSSAPHLHPARPVEWQEQQDRVAQTQNNGKTHGK